MDLILNANDSDCNDEDDSEDSDVEFSMEDANSNGADSSDDKLDSDDNNILIIIYTFVQRHMVVTSEALSHDDGEPLAKLVGASVQQSNKAKKKEYSWRKGTFNLIK